MEGEGTATLVDMTRTGTMMIGTEEAAGVETEIMTDHMQIIITENIMKGTFK